MAQPYDPHQARSSFLNESSQKSGKKDDPYITSNKRSSSFSKMNLYDKEPEFSDPEENDDYSPKEMRLKQLMKPNRQFRHDGRNQDY